MAPTRLESTRALARRLGLFEYTLARALVAAGVQVLKHDSKGSWVRSSSARRAISRIDPRELRDQSRQDRLRVRTSKLWLSGYRELVAEWHPTKNGDIFPDELRYRSNRRVWWKCSAGPDHEWATRVQTRTTGSGCPFCAGVRVSVTNSLANLRPALARQWSERNAALTPKDVTAWSKRPVWWRCPKGADHEWMCAPGSRKGCPFCAGTKLSRTNSLATCYPDVAAEWHPSRNGRLRPDLVLKASPRVVWWRCTALHEWRTGIAQRTGRGTRCPFCVRDRQQQDRSIARRRPAALRWWDASKNGALDPHRVNVGERRLKVWWKCPVAQDHSWQLAPAYLSRCPFCSNKRVSVSNSLATLFPAVAAEWHPSRNGKRTPAGEVAGAARHAWWRCAKGHVWQARIVARTRDGNGCPSCYDERRRLGRVHITRRRPSG